MSDDNGHKGPGKLKPLSPISLRRVDNGAAPVAVRSLTLPKAAPKAPEGRDGPPLFETVRVVDLARFRAGLVRSLSRQKAEATPAIAKRRDFLRILDRVRDLSPDGMPHVAVVSRSQSEGLMTNYSIVGNLIFLGAHLSKSWTTGREDAAYYDALMDAVTTYLRKLESLSGTRTIRRPFYN